MTSRRIIEDDEPYSWAECIALLLFIAIVLVLDFVHVLWRYVTGRRP